MLSGYHNDSDLKVAESLNILKMAAESADHHCKEVDQARLFFQKKTMAEAFEKAIMAMTSNQMGKVEKKHKEEINKVKGKQSNEIEKILGYPSKSEIVHKNDMVILKK